MGGWNSRPTLRITLPFSFKSAWGKGLSCGIPGYSGPSLEKVGRRLCGQGTKARVGVPGLPLAFLPTSLHPGVNEGRGRGRGSGRVNYRETEALGEGLALTGAQIGDNAASQRAVSISVCPDVLSPVAAGVEGSEGRQDVPVFSSCFPQAPCLPPLVELSWEGRGPDREQAWVPCTHSIQLSCRLSS